MNCADIGQAFGLTCTQLGDGLVYLESPIAIAFDGNLIGAYVQDIGRGRVRISDNADTLFNAMAIGVVPSLPRGKRLAAIAQQYQVSLSEAGELFTACDVEQAGFYLARFIEAAAFLSQACEQWQPAVESKFERVVGNALKAAFPGELKRNFEVRGASGHQLKFQFALNTESDAPQIIQAIGAQGDQPNWPSVYHTLGKMLDLKNAIPMARRVVVLQAAEAQEVSKAATALSECASVLVFSTAEQLAADLRQAA
ncbi:DUF1828 domain-containing protein [Pseudomonas sp. NPDC007930]|uniref:DUF1828 domain-containing protein n=1 Tax=Pseudomonas sp. NPDC007930 TaxID=3364417 RepID=UPI0036ECDCF2